MIRFRNLVQALNAAPADRPFITAWTDEDESEAVTFGEFRRRARAQAELLRDCGLAAGDPVVIILPQGIPAMTSFVGAMMLGAIPAFLAYPNFKVDPSKYSYGVAGVTANLRAKAVVIDDEFPDDMLAHVSFTAETKLVRAVVDSGVREVKPLPDADYPAESLAFIQHSAGTTGLQKGVALSHAAVLKQLEHLVQALQVDEAKDRIYSWLPLYHDMGLIACFMLPMVYHLPVVMQSPVDWVMQPEAMLYILSEHKCTLAWLPNFAFQFVPRRTPESRWEQYDLSSVRAIINCSEPIRASSMQEFQNAFAPIGLKSGALQSCYAMAETVFAVTQSDIQRTSGPIQIWADGPRFRRAHRIIPVAEGTSGATSSPHRGACCPAPRF